MNALVLPVDQLLGLQLAFLKDHPTAVFLELRDGARGQLTTSRCSHKLIIVCLTVYTYSADELEAISLPDTSKMPPQEQHALNC